MMVNNRCKVPCINCIVKSDHNYHERVVYSDLQVTVFRNSETRYIWGLMVLFPYLTAYRSTRDELAKISDRVLQLILYTKVP
jgi:hypothetical protein